jgi:hypothetical protein
VDHPKPSVVEPTPDPHRAVRAVRAAVRVGAGHELPRQDQSLLGEVEVEDPVARRRVPGLADLVLGGEGAADRGLVIVLDLPREDEVVVGDRGLARVDRAPARDQVEGVDREGRGPSEAGSRSA